LGEAPIEASEALGHAAPALRALRQFVHARGWNLSGPEAIVDNRRLASYIDENEDPESGSPKRVVLTPDGYERREVLIQFTDEEAAFFKKYWNVLGFLHERYVPKPGLKRVTPLAPEGFHAVASWPLHATGEQLVGKVVRYDPDKPKNKIKKYRAEIRIENNGRGAWEFPVEMPFDLLPFGWDDKTEGDILITEGPKARDAAVLLRNNDTPLGLALRKHKIISWHGAGSGVFHTDWSMCAGAVCRLMCDNDESGLELMQSVAQEIVRVGGYPVLLRFGSLLPKNGLDFADPEYVAMLKDWPTEMFRVEIPPLLPRREGEKVSRIRTTFLRTWVWIPSAKVFRSNITPEECDYHTFDTRFDTRERLSMHKKLGSATECQIATGLVYLPSSPYGLQPKGLFNACLRSPLWDLGPAPTADIPDSYLEFLRESFRDNDLVEAHLDFEADAVAFADEEPRWATLLHGQPGKGKTTHQRFYTHLFGQGVEINPDDLFGAYPSPETMNTHAVFMEELFSTERGDGKAIYQRSKRAITSTTRTMNIKNRPQFTIPNILRIRGCTNNRDALMLEKGDRRWLILEFHASKRFAGKPEEIQKFLDEMRIPLFQALWRRGLNKGRLNRNPPLSRIKREMEESSIPLRHRRLINFAEGAPFGTSFLAGDLMVEFGVGPHVLRDRLPGAGFQALGQRNLKGYKVTVWRKKVPEDTEYDKNNRKTWGAVSEPIDILKTLDSVGERKSLMHETLLRAYKTELQKT
jgi:hypothetical protein